MTGEVPESFDWVAGRDLRGLRVDLIGGSATLALSGGEICFEAVRSTTLLAPWDGKRGLVQWLRKVHEEAGDVCLELRVAFGEIPRVYRIVCGGVRQRTWPQEQT